MKFNLRLLALSILMIAPMLCSPLKELRARALASEDYVIRMNTNNKQDMNFLSKANSYSSRCYSLVIFIHNKRQKNPLVEPLIKEFSMAAIRFRNVGVAHTRTDGGQKVKRPVFFISVENKKLGTKWMSDIIDIFKGIEEVSDRNIYITTPRENTVRKENIKKYRLMYCWRLTEHDGILQAKRLNDHLNSKLELNVIYNEPMSAFLIALAYTFVLFGVLGFIYIKLFNYINHPIFFSIVFIIGYGVAASGAGYMILHGCNWTGIKDDQTEYIFPYLGHQHISEGVAIGIILPLFGLLGFFFFNGNLGMGPNSYLRRIISLVLLYGFYSTFWYLEDWLAKKAYNPIEWNPPNHMLRGSIRLNQGYFV